jgi:hypothetical protein
VRLRRRDAHRSGRGEPHVAVSLPAASGTKEIHRAGCCLRFRRLTNRRLAASVRLATFSPAAPCSVRGPRYWLGTSGSRSLGRESRSERENARFAAAGAVLLGRMTAQRHGRRLVTGYARTTLHVTRGRAFVRERIPTSEPRNARREFELSSDSRPHPGALRCAVGPDDSRGASRIGSVARPNDMAGALRAPATVAMIKPRGRWL